MKHLQVAPAAKALAGSNASDRRFRLTVSENTALAAAALLMLVYYAAVITDGSFHLLTPVMFGTVFNSMLDHLLSGRFDVDPGSIGLEGFAHDGKVYSYFGIVLALIRLPLLVTGHLSGADVTLLSCLVSSAVAGVIKLRTLLVVRRGLSPSGLRETCFLALAVATALGGPQVQMLKPSIFQEAVDWAGVWAALFVYHAIRGLTDEEGFGTRRLCWMAAAASVALSTRVSIGLGLYVALGLLLTVLAVRATGTVRGRIGARFVAPLLLLTVGALICGAVNYARWGNPLTFMDLHLYLMEHTMFPDRLGRLDRTGAFNLSRAWYGLLYFILPIWTIVRPDGHLLFAEYQRRMFDSVEMPPSCFLLTDPLLWLMAGIGVARLFAAQGARVADRAQAGALMIGFAVPIALIVMMLTLALRYKIEFYPELEFAAFLGFRALCLEPAAQGGFARYGVWAASLIGVVLSTGLVFLYQVTPFGPEETVLHGGWFEFYRQQFMQMRPL